MGLPVLHVSRLVGGDGSGIADMTAAHAARCMQAMGGAACEAAPMPLGPRQGTYKRFSGAGRGWVAKRPRGPCKPILGRSRPYWRDHD